MLIIIPTNPVVLTDCSAAGYTLLGATKLLADKFSLPASAIRQNLVSGLMDGRLIVRNMFGLPHTPPELDLDNDRILGADINAFFSSQLVDLELVGDTPKTNLDRSSHQYASTSQVIIRTSIAGFTPLGVMKERVEKLLAAVAAMGVDPKNVPYNAKRKIKFLCMKDPDVFSSGTFDKAWKDASKEGLLRHVNQHVFTKGRTGKAINQ